MQLIPSSHKGHERSKRALADIRALTRAADGDRWRNQGVLTTLRRLFALFGISE